MSNYRRKPSPKIKELDEVEELLRATEDSLVLKLSVNSHLSSSSSSPLDQDLISRFEALKKPSVSKKTTKVPSKSNELKKDDGEIVDPFARFSALKGGGGGGTSSSVEIPGSCGGGSDVSEEDEVEKLMQWAMDAARLDPSLSDEDEDDDDECVSAEDDLGSDDDDLGSDDDDLGSDDDDSEEEKDKEKKKKNEKKKKTSSAKKSHK